MNKSHKQTRYHFYVSIMISSSILQSSYEWSGRYLRIIIGIFLCFSSFMAICNGSVSPSSSTIIGAHMAIWRARVPRTRARSYLELRKQYIFISIHFVIIHLAMCTYFVIYRVVIRLFLGTPPPVCPGAIISKFSASSSWFISSMLSSSSTSSKSFSPTLIMIM